MATYSLMDTIEKTEMFLKLHDDYHRASNKTRARKLLVLLTYVYEATNDEEVLRAVVKREMVKDAVEATISAIIYRSKFYKSIGQDHKLTASS